MGEVYKARDSRLDRIVAIKVLRAQLAADPQFLERFDREAKSISALNDPNICTLYDVGEASIAGSDPATRYLVMEYLEGETLAERLRRGALPIAEALRIASGIASALDRAHRQGIVHRDLKPGNVFLVKGSSSSAPTTVKLLDFGLAKLRPATSLPGGQMTATAPEPLTARGTILGTLQYMAPEQIEGAADARTDIFAFGVLLFEIVTGRRAFDGKSQASLLSAILKDDPPPLSTLQPLAPPALDFLVRTCMAKDPDARFQTAHDVLLYLNWIAEGGALPASPHQSSPIASAASARYGWSPPSPWLSPPARSSGGSCVRRRSVRSLRGSSLHSPKVKLLCPHRPTCRRYFARRDEARLPRGAPPVPARHE